LISAISVDSMVKKLLRRPPPPPVRAKAKAK